VAAIERRGTGRIAMSDYPEHDKLEKINDKSQEIGDFLSWLAEGEYQSQGKGRNHEDLGSIQLGCYRLRFAGEREAEMQPAMVPVTDLLAAYFEIDQDKIETEKRAMLEACAVAYEEAA
jgi:hypothetical protein